MSLRSVKLLALLLSAIGVAVGVWSPSPRAPVGAGRPPSTIYRTERVQGPMPTSDWWSSVAWKPLSEPFYGHPLAFQATAAGLGVSYPPMLWPSRRPTGDW